MKSGILCGAAMVLALMGGAAAAQDHEGDVTLTYSQVSALTQTGQPDPEHDAACQAAFGNWIGRSVETAYNINTRTLMMSAHSTIEGEDVALFPLGIQGLFVFMSDGVPPALGEQRVIRVLFQISMGFDHPESRLMTTLDDDTNCLIES